MFSVEPVFYPWSEDHAALEALVERLLGETKAPEPPAPRAGAEATADGREVGAATGPLPSLMSIVDPGLAGQREIRWLLHTLLELYAAKHGFTYETALLIGHRPDPIYSDIDAIAYEGVPGLEQRGTWRAPGAPGATSRSSRRARR